MDRSNLSEAQARYLDRVVDDCAELLGPGVEVDDFEVIDEAGVLLRLQYHLGAVAWTSEAQGPTMTAAHGALRERLVLDRIRMSTVAILRAGP